jgi:hypothetical protein
MSFSRRKFLRAGTLFAVAAGVPVAKVLAAGTSEQRGAAKASNTGKGSRWLSREAFARELNTKFSFSHPEIPAATLQLVKVNDLTPSEGRPSASATGKECFSAVFLGSKNTSLRQETYSVTHSSLGKFELFVVPVGDNLKGQHFEAVFNRLN